MISQQIKKQTMKKLIIAAIALVGFSAASFAQVIPVKKNDASKMQVVKNVTAKKADAKVVAINKVTKPTVPAVTKTAVVTKPVVTTKAVTKTNAAAPLKKDGTPDKRFKASQGIAAGPLKKDGTADLRYKANKKHS